ncbi:MAG: adenylosuccinate lyase [Phycisphaerae bacterium]|nr:adenylosuccinate lyase [Phycisphaerae bacterium]HBZ96437.1 adenylosuccinate lyase [Phycisphaerales bacterium]
MESSDRYQSPLQARYASRPMQELWSDRNRFTTWRRLWLALAKGEQALGLDITDEQIAALEANLDNLDLEAARTYEAKFRHDVMAHVHALGDQAPAARGIIHLGATSQFVNCNTELIILRDALTMLAGKVARVVLALGTFAETWKHLPVLGFTHYQPAQPTTVGKRATVWAQDFAMALEDIEHRVETMRFRGVKGATGTQASFLALFDGDHDKVEELDRFVTEQMGWSADRRFPVTGQTYPRLLDAQILASLALVASAAHRLATDVRLLANRREVEEPFESTQIGSSAMAYKRNPMRSERICALSRFVMNLPSNAYQTAAVQWFERTLDDSANRRLVLPEACLALDGTLDLLINITDGMIVHEPVITANLMSELPFMMTEDLLMAAVQAGGDRQELHEAIRSHSMEAAGSVKQGGPNDLLDRLRTDEQFAGLDLETLADPGLFVGRAPQQVDHFIREVVDPIATRWSAAATNQVELRV